MNGAAVAPASVAVLCPYRSGAVAKLRLAAHRGDDAVLGGVPVARRPGGGRIGLLLPHPPAVELRASGARYSFLGLMPVMRDALMGKSLSLGWSVATAVAAIAVAAVAAVGIFERAGAVAPVPNQSANATGNSNADVAEILRRPQKPL